MVQQFENSLPPSEWINYLTYILEQVKLQQEVRDRWFGYYLTIAGAVLGIGIGSVKIFTVSTFSPYLWMLLLVLSIAMFLIGSCFFMVYLRQRLNYLSYYRRMEYAEREFLKAATANHVISIDQEYKPQREIIHIHKLGADFYTVWVHIIINSFYCGLAALSIVSILTKTSVIQRRHAIVFTLSIAVSAVILEFVRRRHYT